MQKQWEAKLFRIEKEGKQLRNRGKEQPLEFLSFKTSLQHAYEGVVTNGTTQMKSVSADDVHVGFSYGYPY